MRILLHRAGALGDVVLTTPIARRLRRENPEAEIVVHTAYPDVYRGSPFTATFEADPRAFDRTIDLDLAYERRPDMHIVEAYMLHAFGDPGTPRDRRQELHYDRRRVFLPSNGGRRYVAVHAAKAGWRSRTLPGATWVEACRLLKEEGFWPILVGTQRDALPEAGCTSFHSADLMAQARLIASCDCFVGSDSGLLHVAGATDVPIAGAFTCADPKYRLPWRDGVLGGGCEAVLPPLDCVGCLGRVPPPTTTESCERGDFACVRMVHPESIVQAVKTLLADA